MEPCGEDEEGQTEEDERFVREYRDDGEGVACRYPPSVGQLLAQLHYDEKRRKDDEVAAQKREPVGSGAAQEEAYGEHRHVVAPADELPDDVCRNGGECGYAHRHGCRHGVDARSV